MRRIPELLLALTLLLTSLAEAPAAEFYVAPGGDDTAAGSRDEPFATLTAARDAIRRMKQRNGGALSEPITVYVRGGLHCLDDPLLLLPEDSGTRDCPIVYQSAGDEKPILSGGRPIGNWQKTGAGHWTATLPEVAAGDWYFHQLFARQKGQSWFERRYRPSRGLFVIAGLTDAPHRNPTGRVNHRNPQKEVYFHPGDIQRWENLDDVELIFTHDWSSGRMHIADIDFEENVVRFREFPHYRIGHWYPGGRNPYLVENLKEAFGQAGQWYLDRPTGTLMVVPRQDEDINATLYVAPRLERLAVLRGDLEAGRYVEHVHFRGLKFAHTAWRVPPHFYAEALGRQCRQGFVDMPAAVELHAAKHCRFERCTFANLGSYALDFGDGCHENVAIGNLMYDLGTGGVKVGTVDRNATRPKLPTGNRIENNVISDSGVVHYSGHGIWGGMCARTAIRHNLVTRTLYSAIAVGWSHGKEATGCRDNILEYNHVYDVLLLLDHGGGLYTLGNQPGTVIRGNLIHDTHHTKLHGSVSRPVWAGGALGFDDGSSDFVVEQNIIYNTPTDPARPFNTGRAADMKIGKNYCGIQPGEEGFPTELAAKAGLERKYRDLREIPFRVNPPPVLSMALPEATPPLQIIDTFDRVPVGRTSSRAYCRRDTKSPGEGTDSIAVTDETAAAGGRALKVVDAPNLSRPWLPYVSYSPDYNAGVATVEFAIRVEPEAAVECVWRGSHAKREFTTGPVFSLADGKLSLRNGTTLDIPTGQWLKIKMTARLGAFDPGIGGAGAEEYGRWNLEVTLPDGHVESFEGLKHADEQFENLKNVMFISSATGPAVFYLDEVKIRADN